jgi:hypothetical protein
LNAVIAHHPGHGRRPHFAAAEAGRAVLAEGGNAVEAAIAVAATISVVYPHMNSIGGDGFWLIHRPGQPVVAIDACGRAAAKADLALYAGLQSVPWRGPLAANTVAGAISGWAKAREIAPGTLPLSRLLAEAIAYARDGVSVTAGALRWRRPKARNCAISPAPMRRFSSPRANLWPRAIACASPLWPARWNVWRRTVWTASIVANWRWILSAIWPLWAVRSPRMISPRIAPNRPSP